MTKCFRIPVIVYSQGFKSWAQLGNILTVIAVDYPGFIFHEYLMIFAHMAVIAKVIIDATSQIVHSKSAMTESNNGLVGQLGLLIKMIFC